MIQALKENPTLSAKDYKKLAEGPQADVIGTRGMRILLLENGIALRERERPEPPAKNMFGYNRLKLLRDQKEYDNSYGWEHIILEK